MGIQTYNFKSEILKKWKTDFFFQHPTTFIIVNVIVFESDLSFVVLGTTTADLRQRYCNNFNNIWKLKGVTKPAIVAQLFILMLADVRSVLSYTYCSRDHHLTSMQKGG